MTNLLSVEYNVHPLGLPHHLTRALSCVIGGFMGATFGRVPDVGVLKSVQMKAGQMGADWGKLTAAFSGFTSASTVIRGRYAAAPGVVGHWFIPLFFVLVTA